MKRRFKWIEWNIDHVAKHGVSPEEAESVFDFPATGYPRREKDCYMLWGKSCLDKWLQVAFVKEPDKRIFVFHARPLTKRERRQIK